MQVCKKCSGFGKVLGPVKKEVIMPKEKVIVEEPEKIEMIVSNYAEIIRKKRKELGLKQEDFAKKLSEKESIIHKLETGEFKPSIKMAKKLEKKLGIELIETYIEEQTKREKGVTTEFTIGDMIKIKTRNKQ